MKTGGVIPVVAAVVLQAVPVAVSAISTLYGKSDAPVPEKDVMDILADEVSKKTDKSKEEVLQDIRANPTEYKESLQKLSAGLQENKVVVKQEENGIMTRMGMDWSKAQGYGHSMIEKGAALPVKIVAAPFKAVGNLFGWTQSSKQEARKAEIESKNEELRLQGLSEEEIKQYWRSQRPASAGPPPGYRVVQRAPPPGYRVKTGRGEDLSGLTIAKLVLLVLIIILILANFFTGSNALLGIVAFLLLGLGGVTTYDYVKNGKWV